MIISIFQEVRWLDFNHNTVNGFSNKGAAPVFHGGGKSLRPDYVLIKQSVMRRLTSLDGSVYWYDYILFIPINLDPSILTILSIF